VTRLQGVLVAVLLTELAGVTWLIGREVQPVPPALAGIDRESLHPATWREMARLGERAAEGGPEDWQKLAECYAVAGFFREALASCRLGRLGEPATFRSLYWEGLILDRLGRSRAANQMFLRALKQADSRKQAEYTIAVNAFESLVVAGPLIWHHIGRNQQRLENPEAAERSFEKAGKLNVARYERVRLMVRSQRISQAIKLSDELLKDEPESYQTHQWRARAATVAGDVQASRRHEDLVERTDKLLPTDMVVEILLAEAKRFGLGFELAQAQRLLEQRRPGAAIDRLNRLIEEAWRPGIARLLAQANLIADRPREASRALQRLHREGSLGPLDWLMTGDALLAVGQQDEAIAAWQTSLALRPIGETHRRLADISGDDVARRHSVLADIYDEIATFRRDRSHVPREPGRLDNPEPDEAHVLAMGWFCVAEDHRFRGNTDKARQAYALCLEFDPGHGRALQRRKWLP